MKRIILTSFFAFILFNYINAQTLPNVPIGEAAVGAVTTTDKFQYDNKFVGNYSLGWYNDSWLPGAPTGYLSSAGGLKFFTGYNARLSITSGGAVGINTNNPGELLHIQGTSNSLRFNPDYNGEAFIYAHDGSSYAPLKINGSAISLLTNAREVVKIDPSGNVGIGITNPQAPLHISLTNVQPNGLTALIGGTAFYNAIDTRPNGLNTPRTAFALYGGGTSNYSWNQKWKFNIGSTNALSSNNKNNNQLIISTTSEDDGYTTENQVLTLLGNGNVGIGTSVPTQRLTVDGNTNLINGFNFYLQASNSNPTDAGDLVFMKASGEELARFYTLGDGSMIFAQGTDIQPKMILNSYGNLGVGISPDANYRLAINGKIRATEIKVEAAPWPDYVFSKEYKLPTLQETERHIKEKGYLPGIPSAEEVKTNGVDLGDMNAKLLQKIEELTLYLLEQQKQINALKSEVKELKSAK